MTPEGDIVLSQNAIHENKKTPSSEERADLRVVYAEGRADLRSFRDTFYHVIGILLAATVAIAAAGLEYFPILLPLVPPILALVIMSSVGYLIWRGELIKSLAAIERRLEVPMECAFERRTAARGGRSMPSFFRDRRFQVAIALSIVMIVVLESIILTLA